MKKDFLTLQDFNKEEIVSFLDRTQELKHMRKEGIAHYPLKGKTLGMIFNKPSTRTRISFEVGMFDLGGHSLFLSSDQLQLKRGESLQDSARVLSRYLDGILIRTFDHDDVEELARHATVPVINGLTDLNHPVQVLSDLFTIREKRGHLDNLKVAYVGDGNNLTYSWIIAASILDFQLAVSSPPDFQTVRPRGINNTHLLEFIEDPLEGVRGADVIYTDVWVSMGQEESDQKIMSLQKYQINKQLVEAAKEDALVMHCLPAHRGEEITSEILDGTQSVVFDQAENRLHTQKSILEKLLSD